MNLFPPLAFAVLLLWPPVLATALLNLRILGAVRRSLATQSPPKTEGWSVALGLALCFVIAAAALVGAAFLLEAIGTPDGELWLLVGGAAVAVAAAAVVSGLATIALARQAGPGIDEDGRRALAAKITAVEVPCWAAVITTLVVAILVAVVSAYSATTVLAEIIFARGRSPVIEGAVLLMVLFGISLGLSLLQLLRVRNEASVSQRLWVLAAALRGRRPVGEGLDYWMSRGAGRPSASLVEFGRSVERGVPLDDALQTPGLIPVEVATEAAGSSAPRQIAEVLARAADRHRPRVDGPAGGIDAQLWFVYVTYLPSVIVSILAFLMYFIVPKLRRIFEDFDHDLPWPTELLIRWTDFAGDYLLLFLLLFWAAFLLMCRAVYVGWERLYRDYVGRYSIRPWIPDIYRLLATSVRQGRPIPDSLWALAARSRSKAIVRSTRNVCFELHRGVDWLQALRRERMVNPAEERALSIAAASNSLAWCFEELARRRESLRADRLRTLGQWVVPGLILLLGLVVGFISIAMFMPLAKLISDLS